MWKLMADVGVVAAVAGALVAALASLVTAYISYQSMKNAESTRRQFDMLTNDLTLLSGLYNRLLKLDVPSAERIATAVKALENGDRDKIDRVYEDLKPCFEEVASAFIVHKPIFDGDLRDQIQVALDNATRSEKSGKLGATIAAQTEAISEMVIALDEQFARNRGQASQLD